MADTKRHRFVMAGLLEGWDWFDNALQALLKSEGFASYNKSQSMMIMYVSSGVKRPVEIARKMRLSRQAIGHIAGQLVALRVLDAHDDPTDGRSTILELSAKTRPLQLAAQKVIAKLEARLEKSIGASRLKSLSDVLNADWGVATSETDFARPKVKRAPARVKG